MEPKQYSVKGQIVNLAAIGISNLTVQAFDAGLIGKDDYLGLAITDANGNFEINYSSEYFIQRFSTLSFNKTPDIYFKIYKDGKLLKNTVFKKLKNFNYLQKPVNIILNLGPDPKASHIIKNKRHDIKKSGGSRFFE